MVTIHINDESKQAQAVIEMLKTFPFIKIEEEKPRYNEETEKAMKDAREGKTEKLDLDKLREQLYS